MLPDLVRPRESDLVGSPPEDMVELRLVALRIHALSLSDALGDPVAETVPLFREFDDEPLVPLETALAPALPKEAWRFSEALPVAVVLVLLREGFGEGLLVAAAASDAPV